MPGAYMVFDDYGAGPAKLRSDCLLSPVIQPSLRVKDELAWRNFVLRSSRPLYRLFSHARSSTIKLANLELNTCPAPEECHPPISLLFTASINDE